MASPALSPPSRARAKPRSATGPGGERRALAPHGPVQPPLGCVTLAQYQQGRRPLFYEWTVIAMTS